MIHNEKRQSMEFSNRIDHELFPLISGDLNRPETILANLEARILQLPKQKMMSERLVQLISRVEDLWTRLPESKKPEAKELISDLRQKLKALQLLFSEYELILQMMIPFFKNYGELYHTKRNLLNQYQEGKIPNDVTDAELLAREHEAGRTSLLEILRFAKRERDSIVKKIGDQKSKHLLKADKDTLEELLDTFETDFQTAWNERKKVLTKHAKFCLFTTSLRQLSQDIHSLQETAKIRTTLGETLSSVNAANAYLQEIQPLLQDFKRRINLCEQESKSIMEQMPVHRATVKLGLDQVHERWNILHDWLDTHGQRLSSAVEYFGLLEQSENFSRDANKTLLEWSQRISSLNSKEDAHQLKLEIEKFIKIRKSSQNEIILKISGMAGHVFGDATVQKTQIIQREQEDTFDALTKLFQQVDLYITHEKSINEGIARSQRIQAEAEANIRAAKAEAEAARRAVKEAEEARKRAEEKSIKTKLTQVICHETQTDVDKEASKSSEERSLAPKFVQYLQDQALLEGGRCVLKAKITGTPEPQITWFKDGVAILGNSDYFTQNRNGECSLTIEETFVADSANWSVRASNCAGYAESHAKLTVKELKPIETPSPPKVTLPLRNHQLVEGESLELRCQFSGFPSPQISWFRDGICVDRSKNFTIGEDQGADILRIEQISLSDKGVFSAKAVNNVGQCKTEAKVEIKSVAPALMPEFEVPLENQEVVTGEAVLLECSVTGTPNPEITWFHNNRALKASGDIRFTYDGSKARLMIKHAFPKTLGHYLCKAKNSVGEATSTATIANKPIVPDTSDSEAVDAEPVRAKFKPAFRVPLNNVEVLEDKNVMLECVIVGNPAPDVMWYKDNFPLKENSNLTITSRGDHFQICMKNVSQDQGGDYKVRAINTLGECQSTCRFKILPKKKTSVSSTQTIEEVKQSKVVHTYSHSIAKDNRAPRFIKPIQSQVIDEGGSVKFDGILDGTPWPKVTWTHNGVALNTNPNLKFFQQGQKVSLMISKVEMSGTGQYACHAENEGGSSQCTAELQVQQIIVPPSFVKKLRSCHFKAGDRIIMDIEASGLPLPIVSWYKDGVLLSPSNKIQFRQHGNHFSLIVTKSTVDDSGKYSVELTSSSGQAISQCLVDVKAKPVPIQGPKEKDMVLQSRALNVLSTWKGSNKELPELLPFPFKPEESGPRKRNRGKVPKPSKFIPGEMYHSDYDTDWEGALPAKWKPCYSDAEDLYYKRVRPQLDWNRNSRRPERNPSPPCPHKWESHEEIDKLVASLKDQRTDLRKEMQSIKTSHLTENIEEMTKITIISTRSSSTQQSHNRYLKPLPSSQPLLEDGEKPKIDGIFATVFRDGHEHSEPNDETDPLEDDVKYYKSHAEVVQRPVIPIVTTSAFTPPSSITTTKPNSPCDDISFSSQSTVKQAKKTKFVGVKEKFQRGKDGYGCSSEFSPGSTLERGGGEDRRGGVSTSACSSIDRAYWSKSKTTTETSAQSVEETTPTNTLGRYDNCRTPTNDPSFPIDSDCQNLPKKSSPKIKKRHDGYEADTDDTLKRRKSVRELASSFQEAENACPSPKPIRPNYPGSETEYDSDFESRTTSLKRSFSKLREPSFMKSRAYVPPKWAPAPGEGQSTEKSCPMTESMASTEIHRTYSCQQETRMIRFDNQLVADDSPMNTSDKIVFGQSFNAGIKSNSQELPPNPKSKRVKTIPQFFPKKFIPRISSATEPTSWTFEDQGSTQSKIKAKWAPSDSETEEPSYRKIRPNLKNQSMIESGNHQSNDSKNNSGIVHNIKVEQKNESDHRTQSHSNSYRSTDQGLRKVDPETGLLYFKYDFGYEFGLMVPQEEQSNSSALIKSMSEDLRPRVGSEVLIEMILNVGTDCNVEWRWNNQPLPDDKRRQFLSSGSKHTLVIKEVRTEDNGIYTCLVISPLTTETRSCTLTVEGETLL
ncbi:muscle M-line assembly protein unc-89-like isoform X2 [Tigriopus californicus]|uniref:muscle M-line assembly protein unc-89-like isoform X2 n=1 Tax=Tigriopus californicus TaxID=6832 RepID=UPI0027DA061C|nr:muscle M-line assembly protein unc-89-like isoform X2 [Tigriopus californicus]